MIWRRDTCSSCSLPDEFFTPMDTIPTSSPFLCPHPANPPPAMAFGILTSPFVLGLSLALPSRVTHPSAQAGAVGRSWAEPSSSTLPAPGPASCEVQGAHCHTVCSWPAALCSSLGLLVPHCCAWPWNEVWQIFR